MHLIRICLIIIGFLIISGCRDNIKPDPAPHAEASNYPSAEFYACGKHNLGLGICTISQGDSLQSIGLKLQGYYEGDIKIQSDCGFSDLFHYTDNALVEYNLTGPAQESCMIGFEIAPSYPNQNNQVIDVSGFKGYLLISVQQPGERVFSFTSKIKMSGNDYVAIPAETTGPLRAKFSGCGSDYDKSVWPQENKVIFAIKDIIPNISEQGGCTMYGGVSTKPITYISWFSYFYSNNFQNISRPSVSFSKNTATIVAEDAVGFIAVDSQYKIGSRGKFKVDLSKPFTVRAFTVGGRSQVGDYNPETREIVWIR